MTELLLLMGIVLLLCVFSSKFLYRFGVPSLLIFMVLGMLFGSDGIVGIEFSNYELARELCSIGLIFIMFFGGFGTNWEQAKPVALPAVLMSTIGVMITAGLTGVFSHYLFHINWLEGLLIGAVIASTDAASVFSILRSRKLNLKGGMASLLEIESGSNDPFAYMLTLILLTLMGHGSDQSILLMLVRQIGIGISIGLVMALFSGLILRKVVFEIEGLYPIFVTAAVLFAFSACEYFGGNGFLCVYLFGIILGNSKIIHKRSLVHFFDGISWLMQIMLFFSLGLLSFPSHLPEIFIGGTLLSLFLIFVARPIATLSILSWFKVPIKHQLMVSWVGLRGAASIVFAIYAIASGINISTDIFHIIFYVAVFSVAVQGTLMPRVARILDVIDDSEEEDAVLRTFNDYRDEFLNKVLELKISKNHPWVNQSIIDAEIPERILVLMIKRSGEYIMPKGFTIIQENDVMLLSGNHLEEDLRAVHKAHKKRPTA